LNIHTKLAASLQNQEQADPNDWEATFRQMALFDLAADMELGFFLSYYRNFAIPSIAATLHTNARTTRPSSSMNSSPPDWTATAARK
jgi:hypothetical protein